MKLAFSEFYPMLVLLQNYQTLNFTEFRKILKKHEKLFHTNRGEDWREECVLNVDSRLVCYIWEMRSRFPAASHVERLINEMETLDTDTLESGDRARAMKCLRVPPL